MPVSVTLTPMYCCTLPSVAKSLWPRFQPRFAPAVESPNSTAATHSSQTWPVNTAMIITLIAATSDQHCRARNSITCPASNRRAHNGVNTGTHSSGTMVSTPTCIALLAGAADR